jgi:hypothetical protein
MSLFILIPTFQRLTTLYWSLDSVLKQTLPNNNLFSKILILNNDTSDNFSDVAMVVKSVLKNNPSHNFDLVDVKQGDNSITPIKNMYGAIKENTINGDIAIIHCDDDIMLPNTLLDRYLAAKNSDLEIIVSKFLESAYFFVNDENIYLNLKNISNSEIINLNKAIADDLINYSIPFLSIYTYKISETFWDIYAQAIFWSDELPYEPKIKYPFIPFFIGLSAYNKNKLATYNTNVVIRGHLFKRNFFNFPNVVTEYVNAGIILLTGESVLRNLELKKNSDFDNLRFDFKKTVDSFILLTLFKRDGVKFMELLYLFKTTNRVLTLKTFIKNINSKSLRNLFNNIIFDTRYIKKYIFGWGIKFSKNNFSKVYTKNLLNEINDRNSNI